MLGSFRRVFIKSYRVPIPFCACNGCSSFLVLHFLSLLFLFSILFLPFFLDFMSGPAAGDSAGTGVSRLTGRSRDTSAYPLFPVVDFIGVYGTYLDSQQFEAMGMNGDSASVRKVDFQHNCNPAVGAWKKRWWPWDGLGSSICRWNSPSVNAPIVRVLRRSKIKRLSGNSFLSRASWLCSKFRQHSKYGGGNDFPMSWDKLLIRYPNA